MKWLARLTALLLCLPLSAALAAPAATASPERITDDLNSLFRQSKTIGGAVLVAYKGEIVYEHYYGFANRERGLKIDENTYFRLASVVKMISGIGALHLVDEGKLSLDGDIGDVLGYTVRNPQYPDTLVTLRQLMSHTSGINESGGYNLLTSKLSEMLSPSGAKHNFTSRKPGGKYVYSNFGAGTVGALIEQASGLCVNDYMRQNIFAPLDIDAAYKPSLLNNPDNVANEYDEDGDITTVSIRTSEARTDVADPDHHYRTTIGSLWIRPKDLLKLTTLLCHDGEYNGVRLLKAETAQEMRADQQGRGSVSSKSPYGLFTNRVTNLIKGKTIYGHQGLSNSFVCNAYYDPDADWVFVLLTNGCSNVTDNRIAVLARRLVDYTYKITQE